MTKTPRTYRAICFDLDGTLLPMDLDEFMKNYFAAVGTFVGERGLDAEAFMKALWDGTRSMLHHDDTRTNAEAYWDTFYQQMDENAVDWEALLTEFYEGPFGELGRNVKPEPAIAHALSTLSDKGFPLVLTTMPMFPPEAVRWRLAWAGVDPSLFCRLTTYDNSTSVKPKETYYAENLAALELTGADVLMVGNNTVEDLAFTKLGADAYLITDWLLDPTGNFDLDTVRHGSATDFAAWAETLPPCENPAVSVNPGPVEPTLTAAILSTEAPVATVPEAEAPATATPEAESPATATLTAEALVAEAPEAAASATEPPEAEAPKAATRNQEVR